MRPVPLVREMLPEERAMVLSDWKRGLHDSRPAWGKALPWEEWWALVNHVVDRISLPSARVVMACHESEPKVPLCWMAVRDGSILHMYARVSVQKEPELAAFLERTLVDHTGAKPGEFNPFQELKR